MATDHSLPETLYETMIRIRGFEERTTELFLEGRVKGTAHSYVGEEAVAAGACAALRDDDYIASNHRGHGHCIAKGADLDRMMAELMGRDDGYCRGLGGSMHIADLDLGILGANGIVGAGLPLGTGAGLAARLRGSDQVALVFFGDGASQEGISHEALNLTAVWKLPVIFVCENNRYGLSTPFEDISASKTVAQRAAAYEIPGEVVDGNDVMAVHQAVNKAVARARAGDGPSLIEARTYRWGQHSMRANLADPRGEDEIEAWKARDPIVLFERQLTSDGTLSSDEMQKIRDAANQELEAAVRFAEQSPEPTIETMEASVYAPHVLHNAPPPGSGRDLSFPDALNEAFRQEMERDESVFVMGEDVGKTGGIFTVTQGLRDQFGAERVRDTPIAEAIYSGAGVGAAIAGMRPVIEVQIFDFVTLMMDMIVNQAAKFRYMNGGKPKVPIVIRGPQGGGIRLAAQHSQSLEAWFTHVPGLVVVAPSSPYDAKGLLTAAIRDDNPVMFLEHKMLYLSQSGPVPEESYAIPLGRADIKREGSDVTVVATQMMVHRALAAAGELEKDGINVEVIDPRTLYPLDLDTIIASVRKTNRVVIAHEAVRRGGYGAEISAQITEQAFDHLDAPVGRVGARNVPIPYNDTLERAVIPGQQEIVDAVRSVL